jgi:hypothetical protein
MNIRVQGPDGVVIEFPAGTDSATITGVMQKRYGGPQAKPEPFDMPAPPPGAVIHGGDGKSYVAGQPGLTVDRGKVAGTPQETIMLEAQKRRAASGFDDTRRMMPLAQGLGLGAADEVVSGLAAAPNAMRSGNTASEEFAVAQEMQRQALERTRTERPVESFMGELAGSAATGIGAMGAGATTARFVGPNAGLGARMLSGAADGAIFGGVTGFNSGDGGEDRAKKAAQGAAVGGGVGATMPVVSALLGRVTQPVRNAISARVNPDRFAERQISATMQEAGRAPQDIEAAMLRAAQEGQGGVYTIADELGDAGARQLGVAYRGPGEAGNIIKNTLQSRQEGQARRIGSFVEDAFGFRPIAGTMPGTDIVPFGFKFVDTPATVLNRGTKSAEKLTKALKKARSATADQAYDASRAAAGPVDTRGVVSVLDERLSKTKGNEFARDEVDKLFQKWRNRLVSQSGDETISLSDYSRLLSAKRAVQDDIDNLRQSGLKYAAGELSRVRNSLDEALEAASEGYRKANDDFRTASKVIDAVEQGRSWPSSGRAVDNVSEFASLGATAKRAARVGYGDNLLEKINNQSAPRNKAALFSPLDTRAEIDAIALKPASFNSRIAREQRMFETGTQAAGGSQTATRMADDAGVSIGPESMANIARGNFLQPLLQALNSRGLGGNTPQARAAMAEILLARAGNSPDVLKRLANRQISDAERGKLVQILLAGSANAATATGMANTGQK